MLIVLSGGGTAGHINPALALADVLKQRGCEVRFAGTPTGVEARLVREAGIPFTPFEAQGFNRNHPLTLPKAVLTIQKSTTLARRWFDEIRPDAVVGLRRLRVHPPWRAPPSSAASPVVVHEQNSVMGMANKYLAKRARRRVPHLRARGRGAGRQEPRPGDRQPRARKRVLGHARAGPRALRRAGGRAHAAGDGRQPGRAAPQPGRRRAQRRASGLRRPAYRAGDRPQGARRRARAAGAFARAAGSLAAAGLYRPYGRRHGPRPTSSSRAPAPRRSPRYRPARFRHCSCRSRSPRRTIRP